MFYILYLTGKFRHSFDGIKGVSFDGLTSRGIDRDRISFSSTGSSSHVLPYFVLSVMDFILFSVLVTIIFE